VNLSRGINQDSRTWARGHGFTDPVEASRPRDDNSSVFDPRSQRTKCPRVPLTYILKML
jgi:hypothetical protein